MTDPLGGLGRIPAGVAPQRDLNGLPGAAPASDPALSNPGRINFRDVLMNSLEQVNQFDKQAQASIATGLAGNDLTQAEVFTAVKKADLAFRTMMQIRNKVVEAYNEVKQMRM